MTVRAVSAEAGWSTGAVRYYFPDQASLRNYAVATLSTRLTESVRARIWRPRPDTDTVGLVASILEELLPIDDQRREEYVLWDALVEWEKENPECLPSRMWDEQRGLYQWAASTLIATPPDRADVQDVTRDRGDKWISYLHVFTDGLASQMIHTPKRVSPENASKLLRNFLLDASESLNAPTERGDAGG